MYKTFSSTLPDWGRGGAVVGCRCEESGAVEGCRCQKSGRSFTRGSRWMAGGKVRRLPIAGKDIVYQPYLLGLISCNGIIMYATK